MMAYYKTDKLGDDKSSNGEEFTLYVNNLPAELNKHGLLQIFNHYGQVKKHFYRPNTDWAYITYGSYLEAENAIKDLHNIPPLRLKVSFAKKERFNAVQLPSAPIPLSAPDDVAQQYENYNTDIAHTQLMQTIGRGKPLNVFQKVQPNPGLPKYTYTADNDLLYPYPSEPHIYNPYENAEPYANTNTLWTRGQLSITQDGKRHVSFGRGYTFYKIPDPDPEVYNQINKVYEKRTSGLYEYGRDMLQNAIGTCKICSKKTKYTCERCLTFYCSRNCQLTDWPQHKVECKTIPALVTAMHSIPTSQLSSEEQTPTRNISNIQVPLRRPKKLEDAISNSKEVFDAVSNDKSISNVSVTVCEGNTSVIEKEVSDHDVKRPEKLDNHENIKNWQKFSVSDIKKIEEDISFTKHTFLSKTEFTDVRIVIKEDREFWIQKVEDESAIALLMNDLQSVAQKARKVIPVIGNIYAVKYEDIWHRAIVTDLNPLKVQYIDFGNYEIIKTDEFLEIDKYKNVPRFCAKIRLSKKAYEKYKDLKYEDVIRVKMITVDANKVINVEVQNENEVSTIETIQTNSNSIPDVSTTSNLDDKTVVSAKRSSNEKASSSFSKLKNIINTVTVGEKGILEIHAEMKNNTYSITLLPNNAISDYEKLLNDLPAMCTEVVDCSKHRPNIGDLICGQRIDGDWLRGYILSVEPSLKMAIVDEARIMQINKTVACPKTFLNICAFGAICEVTDTKYKFNESDQYEFKVISQTVNTEQDKIEIEVLKDQDKLKAIIRPWIPHEYPEQTGLQYAQLKNGSEVSLTAYRSHTLLFARPLDIADLEYYNRIMQNVAKFAQISPLLKEPPVVGQMVIAQYTDQNYYRAIVTKIQDDNIAISYVDFGNTEVTNIKKLKILPDNLKQLRSCTAKIILKDVPKDVPMTKEVNDYLSHLVGAEVPLLCTFDGIPSEDGVYLKLHNGEEVNKTISELLSPVTKETAEKDKSCYMEDDLNAVDLGSVGDTVDAVLLYIIESGYKYSMCRLDQDLMTHVLDIMPKQMTAYCEASDYYIPREKELCLARYEDGWYRAVCSCRNYTTTASAVFFVDFGNIEFVDHKNIRLMPKDFITPYALASICNIVNIAPTDNEGRYSPEIEKRMSELLSIDTCVKIKIVECDLDHGTYNVELPLVKAKLIEENLISA